MNTKISKQELNSTLNGLNTDYKRRYDTIGKILGQYFTHYNFSKKFLHNNNKSYYSYFSLKLNRALPQRIYF